jgi:long-chain acyl-CoA synthetase
MPQDTIPFRLHQIAANRGHDIAYREKKNGVWQPTTWSQYLANVRQAAKSLVNLGVDAGGATAILGFNRPEWTTFHLASMLVGATPAGIYATNAPSEVQYVVHHAEARVLLIEDSKQWTKVRQVFSQTPTLATVVLMRGMALPDDAPTGLTVLTWEQFMAIGSDVADAVIDARLEALTLEQPGTFIYTSGTTGPPKAVALSHKNLAWTSLTMAKLWQVRPNEELLSYLPLSHIAEQMFSIHGPISVGFTINFAESGEKVADNIKEVRPTVFFAVPRVWERFHQALSARLAEATGVRARLVSWARGVAGQVTEMRNHGQTPGGLLALQYSLANRLVFHKIKTALGLDRTWLFASSAAPISPHIVEFFGTLDINIFEIYGQSEGSGPTTAAYQGNSRLGKVGKPIPNAEVKLTDEGEIILRGNNVFLGYYKDPEATAATLRDGWLYSGDLGSFDDEGFLTITGRKKDIIITSGGKNIAPKNIEAALQRIDLVAQAVVIGEGRRFISALLTLNDEALKHFTQAHNLAGDDLHNHPQVIAAVQAGVDRVNADLARVEQVRKFTILSQPFSVENGELTPTLKIKRNIVAANHTAEIEAMYAEA